MQIMTEEEVIKQLKKCKSFHNGSYGTAINLAIKALEQTELNSSYNGVKSELDQQPCKDCISRQAVLDYIEGSGAELGHSSENELVCQDIKKLPSVTPKTESKEGD